MKHYHVSLHEYENSDDDRTHWLRDAGCVYADPDAAQAEADRLDRLMPVEAIAYHTYNSRACEDPSCERDAHDIETVRS